MASDRAGRDYFSESVSISGDYAIVGTPAESEDASGTNTVTSAGSAYIFKRDGTSWSQQAKLVASDRAESDNFGVSVSISGDYAIVGANGEDEDASENNYLNGAGSAYIFKRNGINWSQEAKLVASDRAYGDEFGGSVSISGDYAIVGAYAENEDASGNNTLSSAGSAYIFNMPLYKPTTRHVPSEYATIQAGLDAANESDTVLLAPGNYNDTGVPVSGYILNGKNITLASYYLTTGDTSYISQTIINNARIYYNGQSDNSLLSGLTIRKGDTGVSCYEANPRLDHLIIKECSGSGISGGANSNPTITNCIVKDNLQMGIHISDGMDGVIIKNSIITNNGAWGIYIKYSRAQIDNCISNYNACGLESVWNYSMLIKNSKFQYNKKWGGVKLQGHDDRPGARLENVLVTNNSGAFTENTCAAGGITLTRSHVTMVNVTVADNQANPLWGGGILVYGGGNPFLINSIISSNSSPQLQSWHWADFKIAYSTINIGNEVPVTTKYYGTYHLLENIKFVDPFFEEDYSLQAGSPCIDEGAAYYSMNDSVYVNMGSSDYVGAAPDMGAYEYAVLIPSIVADFNVHGLNNGPTPLAIQFIDFSQEKNTSINSWHWDFGDEYTSTAPNPQHTYITPGVYSVSLTVSDGSLSDTKVLENCITVLETPPTANFSSLVTSGFAPFQTVFKNESTGNISSLLWDFGDGQSSTLENPYHTYQDTGTYTVQLIASNAAGADTSIKVDYISVSQSNAKEIFVSTTGSDDTGTGSEAEPYLTIQKGLDEANNTDMVTVLNGTYLGALIFDGKALVLRSKNGPENCIIDCDNKLDGLYLYSAESQTTVIQGFTITNADYGLKCEGASPLIQGNIITACKVGIYASINWGTDIDSNPIIYKNLICDNTEQGICVGESGSAYIVNNTISRNGTTGVETFLADITVVNNIITDHVNGISFLSPGNGSVFESHNCLWNNTTQYFNVVPDSTDIAENPLFISAADFHLQETSPCIDAGNPLFPLDPDGSIVDMGVFYYSQILDSLIADYKADVLNGTSPLTVVFSDKSEGEPIEWNWEFGDGSTSQEQHPSHVYTEPGIYTVKLLVNDGSLSDSLTKVDYITVNELVVNPPKFTDYTKLENGPDVDGSNYYQISSISDEIAYLATSNNRIYKTTNGGSSWQNISPEVETNLQSALPKVHFINENIGSVSFSVDDGGNGYNYDIVYGYAWCTRDGGQTWSQRFDVNEDQITHLQQVTENIAYISGSARLGVTSTRWFKKIIFDPEIASYSLQSITPMPTSRPHVRSADWLNQNTGIALARYNVNPYTAQLFMTRNAGMTWNSIQGDLPQMGGPALSYSDQSVQILDENSFIIVVLSEIWRTDDGGSHWVKANFNSVPGRLVSLAITENLLDGIAVGYDSTRACFITHDGGFNWEVTVLPEIGNHHLYGCSISPDGSVWINGNNKGLWKSSLELIADLDSDTKSGNAPLEVHFLDKSQQGTHNITSWNWQFGDGESSTVQNPVHTYGLPGNYTVSLTVGDGTNSDTKEKVNYIRVENSENAVITAVADVPADQGGWVTVHFIRSGFDTDSLDVLRAMEDSLELYTVEINDGSGWVSSNSTVAYGAGTYSVLAHTSVDSSEESSGILNFRVISGMTEGNFSSIVVTGYSVDNLAPAVPTGLSAEIAASAIVIDWNPSMDNDFQYYNIYRSVNEDFSGQSISKYSSTTESTFTDETVEADKTYYYRVTAIDFNGNESNASETASILVGIDDLLALPEIFELSQNYPNPFNPITTLEYGLPEVSDITLTIISLTGRKIEQWSISNQQPGWHEVVWDGSDMHGNTVPTGVYIYSLQAGDFVDTKKMVFMK